FDRLFFNITYTIFSLFCFNATDSSVIYTLSLHDALPIFSGRVGLLFSFVLCQDTSHLVSFKRKEADSGSRLVREVFASQDRVQERARGRDPFTVANTRWRHPYALRIRGVTVFVNLVAGAP